MFLLYPQTNYARRQAGSLWNTVFLSRLGFNLVSTKLRENRGQKQRGKIKWKSHLHYLRWESRCDLFLTFVTGQRDKKNQMFSPGTSAFYNGTGRSGSIRTRIILWHLSRNVRINWVIAARFRAFRIFYTPSRNGRLYIFGSIYNFGRLMFVVLRKRCDSDWWIRCKTRRFMGFRRRARWGPEEVGTSEL